VAVPKKKTSVSRKGLRRAGQHHKLYAKTTNKCSNCGAIALPHYACSSCGTYSGREAFAIKVKKEDSEEAAE
jgi:large subunit ribosomal protein L32